MRSVGIAEHIVARNIFDHSIRKRCAPQKSCDGPLHRGMH
jgi:hypothetical protein